MSTVRGQTEASPGQAAPAARPRLTTDARAVSVAGLLGLQRTAGNRAVTRLLQRSNGHPPDDRWGRVVADLERRLGEVGREIDEVERIADDLLGGRLHGESTLQALERLAQRGNKTAEGLLEQLRQLLKRHRRLFDALERARERLRARLPGGGGQGGAPGGGEGQSQFDKGAKAGEKEAGKEAEKTVAKEAEKTVAKEAEKTVVKEAEKKVVKEAGERVVKEAGGAAAERVGKGTLLKRVAAKIGPKLLEALVPDPLDALELMVDFAKSFTEAREAIRRRNLEDGFAVGWAAYLVVPRWEWAKWFALTVASKDVATQVVGAVGVAENAFNEGLVRGFIYGEKHTAAQTDRVRQKAFDAVLKVTGHAPGRYDGDDVYTFGRDDVYAFAGALHTTAVGVLKEADKRREARLEAERLKKHQEALQKRFDAGHTWPR
jgi:hypothetical protein